MPNNWLLRQKIKWGGFRRPIGYNFQIASSAATAALYSAFVRDLGAGAGAGGGESRAKTPSAQMTNCAGNGNTKRITSSKGYFGKPATPYAYTDAGTMPSVERGGCALLTGFPILT